MLEETEFIDEDIKLAVKRGAAWLDENDPEWVQKIQLETLKMSDSGQCILGQTRGHYAMAISKICGDEHFPWANEHGFNLSEEELDEKPIGDIYRGYRKLDQAWTEYIKNRRAK